MEPSKRSSTGASSGLTGEQEWFRSSRPASGSEHASRFSYSDPLSPRPLFTSEPDHYEVETTTPPIAPPHTANARSPTSSTRDSISEVTSQWPDMHGATPVYSPRGSIMSHRSRGTARSRNSVQAPRSMSRSSRPEPYREGRPLDSPMISTLPTAQERNPSGFSFDEGPRAEREFFQTRRMSDRNSGVPQSGYLEVHEPAPERIPSGASASTIPASLFRDFDGVHLDEVAEEPEHDTYVYDQSIAEEPEHDASTYERSLLEEPEHDSHSYEPSVGHEEHVTQDQEHHKADAIVSSGAVTRIDEAAPPTSNWYDEAAKGILDELNGPGIGESLPVANDAAVASSHGAPASGLNGRQTPNQRPRWVEPPPQEGMAYYPAPVPMNINLPKRLSVAPNLDLQSKRRTQWLESLPPGSRQSVPWLSQQGPLPDDEPRGRSPTKDTVHRKKPSNMKNLPPQLRASLFFDQPAVEHKVPLKRGSAMLTLEELLDESTTAPVTAFKGITDSNIVPGHGRSTSMLMSNGRPSSRMSIGSRLSGDLLDGKSDGRMSRGTMLSNARSKSIDRLNESQSRPGTSLSHANGVRLVQSEDGLSRLELDLNDESQEHGIGHDREQFPEDRHIADEDDGDVIRVPGMRTVDDSGDNKTIDQDLEEYPEQFGQPTTLLAELQLRKAKLKQRTRNAAETNAGGMHATLLQLEAVAQIERRKRQDKKTALAWEDPNLVPQGADANAEDDEDVPLGMLFPERYGLINKEGGAGGSNSAMGLIEKRQMENNESLMARRNRLLGIKPAPPEPIQQEEPDDKSEHGDETLAQRTRRLRSRKALDDAIGVRDGAVSRAISDDFASEMMSQFGGGISKAAEPSKSAAQMKDSPPEEETLGQRRRRLQAESMTRTHTAQPSLRSAMSMSNILSAAPVTATGSRNVSGGSGAVSQMSGLLGDSELRRQRSRQTLLDYNERSGIGMGLGDSLLNLPTGAGPPQLYTPTAAPARQGWGIPAHSFSQGFGAIQAPQPRHPRGSMLWAAQEEQRSRIPLGQYNGQGAQQTYAAGAMHQQHPSQSDAMTNSQRDTIDRWRQSILH